MHGLVHVTMSQPGCVVAIVKDFSAWPSESLDALGGGSSFVLGARSARKVTAISSTTVIQPDGERVVMRA
jgi:hypothetical protein